LVSEVSAAPQGFWKGLKKGKREKEGLVYLPRFKKEFGTDLGDSLAKLGCNSVFKDANFSKVRTYFI
jgi:serine protease inhibitor